MNPLGDKIDKVLIARTEQRIGDVILTLPLAGILKSRFPNIQIAFLGSRYAESIVKKTSFVDEFYIWNRLKDLSVCNADAILLISPWLNIAKAAWQAEIPFRIGTARRWHHWFYANRRVFLKHRPVNLHESQLVTSFLQAFGIEEPSKVDELHRYYGWGGKCGKSYPDVISDTRHNIILHPRSKGSAPEWPLDYYYHLSRLLDEKNFNIIISGTNTEKDYMQKNCPDLFVLPHITDITGQYDLSDFINIVEQADCLVASSTGPTHLAAAAGINTIGLYAPVRPQHPDRWKPIGKRVKVLCKGSPTGNKREIDKIKAITPEEVQETIVEMIAI